MARAEVPCRLGLFFPRCAPDESCRQDRQVECIYKEASGLEGSEIMQFARENSTPCPPFGESGSGSGPSSDGCSTTLSQAPTRIGARPS
jgi:hypothetical protein